MRRVVMTVLLLAGCGSGGSGTAGSDVEGNWISPLGTCAHGMDFSDNQYVDAVICVDSNAVTYDLQEEKGTFTLVNGEIHYAAQQSTCPATAVVHHYTPFAASPSSLTLTYSDGVTVFQRNTAAASGVTATFGCFTAGVFTPGPLVAL